MRCRNAQLYHGKKTQGQHRSEFVIRILARPFRREVSADIDRRSLVRHRSCSSNADGHAQEGGGDQSSAIRALVFCVRQLHQLGVEIVCPSALLGRLYGVHGRAVEFFK